MKKAQRLFRALGFGWGQPSELYMHEIADDSRACPLLGRVGKAVEQGFAITVAGNYAEVVWASTSTAGLSSTRIDFAGHKAES